jgi:DNA integrity scanning protein DisA with diadenylate cyclase activity
MAAQRTDQRENAESRCLATAAFDVAKSLSIEKLLVQVDEPRDVRLIESIRNGEHIVWMTRTAELLAKLDSEDAVVRLPETSLARISQMKIGLLLAVLNGHVAHDESVLYLAGTAGSERLDTLLIVNPSRDFPWFGKRQMEKTQGLVRTRELARLVEIALRLAVEGREGSPIGTILVLGNAEELAPHLRQLVLNPCKGHRKAIRSIHDPAFFETIREFAALDGAFLVNEDGVVASAGTYLSVEGARKTRLAAGLGARHAAAALITSKTAATSVVVSASSGTVSVFRGGKAILELERPLRHPAVASAGNTK